MSRVGCETMNPKMVWIVTLVVTAIIVSPAAACCCRVTGGGQIENMEIDEVWASYGFVGQPFAAHDDKPWYVDGQWNHIDHLTGAHFHAPVDYLHCYYEDDIAGPDVPDHFPDVPEGLLPAPGPKNEFNKARIGGAEGKLTDDDGVHLDCTWEVIIYDVNEPGIHRDGYKIDVTCPDGATLSNEASSDACDLEPLTGHIGSGNIDGQPYSPIGCVKSGNIQIHPTNNGHPCIP